MKEVVAQTANISILPSLQFAADIPANE